MYEYGLHKHIHKYSEKLVFPSHVRTYTRESALT